mgnify:CR=1 FL=1
MIDKLAFYAVNNIFCILILLVISFHFSKQSLNGNLLNRLYMAMLVQAIIMLTVDLMGSFVGDRGLLYILLCRVGNFLVFIVNPVMIILWVFYVDYHLYGDVRRLKQIAVPLIILYSIHFMLVIFSQFTGWLYYVDENNVYHRGPYFFLHVVLTCCWFTFSYIEIIRNRNKMIRRHYYSLMLFAVPPILGMALQMIFYGLTIMLNGIVLTLIIVFIMVQNEYMQTDFLTGLYNRYKLEHHLKEKMKRAESERFAVVMLDLNDFKHINDTYGHRMGDKALKMVAQMLKESSKVNDFIARYGGDEFIIVYENIDQQKLEKKIGALEENLRKINSQSDLPCPLSFSIGSAIFDGEASMSLDELLQLIDCRLYENKRRNQL